MNELIPASATEEEFSGLVDIFKRDVDTILKQQSSRMKVSRTGATQQLILQLMAPKQGSTADGKLTEDRLHQTSTCLRLLSRLMDPPDLRRQRALNSMGASAVAISMAACTKPECDELSAAGLELMSALLNGGDIEVQRTMQSLLSESEQQDLVKPFDGSDIRFLASMRERLRFLVARRLARANSTTSGMRSCWRQWTRRRATLVRPQRSGTARMSSGPSHHARM